MGRERKSCCNRLLLALLLCFLHYVADMRCGQSYAIARVVIPKVYPINNIPWYSGVSSTQAPSNFSLKALCSEEISITNTNNRRTILGRTLDYGAWKKFTLNVLGNISRILVEISCSHDNMLLLLKPISGGHPVSDMLPSELDMEHYGDMASLKNQLSHLYRFIIGEGRFFIGIFNNDGGIQETAYFNATIVVESVESSIVLCPRNCSYPRGHCIEDNVCQCENGYGGPFCEGSLLKILESGKRLSGVLNPGEVAYFIIESVRVRITADLCMQFYRSNPSTALVGRRGGFPTLTNFSFDLKLDGNQELFKLSSQDFAKEDLVFAVFNVDYSQHRSSIFRLTFLFSDARELKSWATLLIALCCSILVFLFTIALTTILQRYLQSGQQMNEESDLAEITTDGSRIQCSLNKAIIEKCPTLDFIEGTMLTREAQCSICLSKYVSGDGLREIPLCSHRFHICCIEAWLLQNLTCPLCRSDLLSLSTMPKNA